MGRRIRDGVIEGQVFDLFGEHFYVLFKIPDHVVLSATGFALPSGDLLPQARDLIAHLLDNILVLLSVRREALRHRVFDLSLDQRGDVSCEIPGDLRRNFRPHEDALDLRWDAL